MGTPLPPRVLSVTAPRHLQQQQETTMYGKKGHTRAVAAVQAWKAELTHVGRDKEGSSSLMMAVGPRASPAALR